ncbi:MAG: DNA-3-methyladenine glycosylase [Ruminococcaceae bacterium]|nr:DNA-3-methyladenine glycosylase [Oscillospiraceae bacterium]
MKRLNPDYFKLPATELAPLLLGKLLCVSKDGVVSVLRITETEAYFGEEDTACHAHKGRTPRTEILYSAGGRVYVYLCYGIHSLMNIISGEEGHPEGVLIRGVEGYNGPGKLTKHLGIDRTFNNLNVIDSDVIWISDDGYVPKKILTSARIGIDYASEEFRYKPWRFYIEL